MADWGDGGAGPRDPGASPEDRWRALAAASLGFAATCEPDAILQRAAETALGLTRAEHAVASYTGGAAARTASAGSLRAAGGPLDAAARRLVVETNAPLRLPPADPGAAPGPDTLAPAAGARHTCGWLGVPLRAADGSNAGVIEVADVGGFDDLDEAILVQLAAVASVALENAGLVAASRAAEATARDAEARYRALVEHGPDAVAVFGEDGRIRFASPAIERLLGYPIADLVGRDTTDRIHPGDLPRVTGAFRDLVATRRDPIQMEFRMRHADGTWRWLAATGQFRDGDPDLGGVVVNLRDISDRVAAAEVLRASEARFRALTEHASDVTSIFDRNARRLYTSAASERILGYAPDELLGDAGVVIDHPDDIERIGAWFAALAAEPGRLDRIQQRAVRRDGAVRWMEVVGQNRLDDPDIGGIVLTGRDITDRKAAEDALRASEERVRAAFEDAAIGMAIVALDGTFLRVNRALGSMLGYAPTDLVGTTWMTLTHPDDRELNADQAARLRSGDIASYAFEKRYLRRDGTPVWALVTTAMVRDEAGSPLHLVTQMQDITARRAAERARDDERDLLRALMDSVPDPIVFKDRESRFTRVNAAAAAMYGLGSPAEAVGLGNADVYPAAEAAAQSAIDREVIATGTPVIASDERFVGRDGKERRLLTTKVPIAGPDGRPAGLVGISRDVTDFHRATAAVAQNEARLRALLGRLPVLVYVEPVDPAGPIWVGAHVEAMYGLDEATYVRTLADRRHPDDAPRFLAEIARADQTGEPFRIEYRERAADGTYIWVRDHAVLVRDERGEPDYWLGAKVDITEVKRGEAALRDAEERYRRLIEQIPAVVYTAAADDLSRPLYASPQIEQLLGYTPDEWIGDEGLWRECVHPEDRERVSAEVAHHAASGQPVRSEFRFLARDGRIVWVLDEAVLVPGSGGRPGYWLGFLVDIGDRRRAEEALREQAERLAEIISAQADVAAAQPDPDEVMRLVAERVRALAGADGAAVLLVDGDHLVYRAAAGLAAVVPTIRLPIDASLAGLSLRTGRLLRADDATTDPRVFQEAARRAGWRSLVVMPLRHRGQTVGALQVMSRQPSRFGPRDAQTLELMAGLVGSSLAYADAWTAMREARDAAQEANRLKSQFLSTMSHELRTPMNAIIGYAHLLLDGMDGELTPPQADDVRRIAEGADRLLALIDDVLDLARIEAGRMELDLTTLDLDRVLEHARADVAPQAAAKGLALTFDVPPGLTVDGDPGRLRQVFTNLVGNAVKFTERGSVAVTATTTGDEVLVSVIDSGIGIAEEMLPRVFDEFLQADAGTNRRYGGTGLGLAITRRLVEMHGGNIRAESEPGAGSVFTVRLPRSR